MPKDVYAVIGALVRTEITRTHNQPPHPSAEEAAVREEIAAPKPPALVAASPAPVRRRLHTRATAILRRLAAIPG
ncbi:hypothetical protein OHA74_12875 [Streptomyces phaeochromogenes]|uniref:hypothetical protein n=1 Tax=Streptomyces phaeochromogenes TaxID=1923 RepID=UPI002E27C0AF|nr:hypothetical protein [Streptomyces phaeochromogenes]